MTHYHIELNSDAKVRPVLATNGSFYHPDMIGPGHDLGAKIWKTKAGAKRYAAWRWEAGRINIIEVRGR